jgi:hypothetical protein
VSSADPPRDHDIDALVRAHLRRRAEGVDPAAVLAGARRRLAPPTPAPRRAVRPAARRVLWASAAAALAAVALLGGRLAGPAQASAETLVREAREAHALPVDRCYLVQTVPAPGGAFARFPLLSRPRQTRLWTRGDRFWLESADPRRHWAWGRDEHGTVWLALGPGEGLRYDPDEVPEGVAVACDVLGMRVETLLGEVLRDFDLRREPADPGATTWRVRAEPKPGRPHPALRSALLEIDAETRVLRRLVLERTLRGRPLATVTLTLVETGSQPDAAYQLAGHLDPGAPVFTREHERLRRPFLLRAFFGMPPDSAGD